MFEDESFDETLTGLRASDEAAATAVFQRYVARLIVLAGKMSRVVDPAPSPVEAAMLSETVEELLRDLDIDDRPIVEHILQGYTAEETAARLDCSERTVRRVRGRAKQCLERLIGPDSAQR
jgi:DNA-directed RNA polymerase specialized sigma24 family protein